MGELQSTSQKQRGVTIVQSLDFYISFCSQSAPNNQPHDLSELFFKPVLNSRPPAEQFPLPNPDQSLPSDTIPEGRI